MYEARRGNRGRRGGNKEVMNDGEEMRRGHTENKEKKKTRRRRRNRNKEDEFRKRNEEE